MEHHDAVYDQIIQVSNTNQEADFLAHHLVQEIVVSNDSNQEPNINIAGMDIVLPNDCITVQDHSNIIVSCNTDAGIESDKPTVNAILQEPIKVECISDMNDIATSYTENHKEVKVQQYELQDATTFSEEGYEATNSALASSANIDRTLAESIIDTTASMSPSTLVAANHTLLDNYNVDSSNGTKTKENGCIGNKVKDTTQSQETSKSMEIHSALVEESESTDVNVLATIDEEQIDSQVHSTNKETKENAKSVQDDNNSNVKTEHYSENSPALVREAQINEIVTEAQILTNSDDIAVMAEFSSIEYSAEEEIAAPQETRHGQVALAVQISTLESISVKSDLIESNVEVTVKADAEFLESKLEPGSNEDSYNQSSQDEIDLHLTMQSTDCSHRKVIQDIFDDWQDENCEEENNQSSGILKHHQDSVEKELQNLLNDDAQQVQTVSSTNAAENSVSSTGFLEQDSRKSMDKSRSAKSDNALLLNASTSAESTLIKSCKTTSSRSSTRDNSHSHSTAKSTTTQEEQKKVHPRPGVKVPGSHLTSPIASTAEVAEALTKRLREKQKDLVVPKTADVVFVKKISQRLSNQLSQVVASMPPMVPLQQTPTAAVNDVVKNKSIEETPTATSKASLSDNNDLLAILEGDDADSEWSNLKPESSKACNSNTNSSPGGKLDPITERELALKQLLELPNITSKKNATVAAAAAAGSQKKQKKPAAKDSPTKAPKERSKPIVVTAEEVQLKPTVEEIISLDSAEEDSPKKTKKPQKENSQNTRNSTEIKVETGIDESRSGRKRKLTEKAREHELAVKRQKVFKNKVVENKKISQDVVENTKQKADATVTSAKSEKIIKNSETTLEDEPLKTEVKKTKIDSKTTSSPSKTENKATRGKILPIKKSKLGLLKKNSSITKKKLAVRNLLRQRAASKNAAAAKSKQASKATDGTSEKSTTEKTVMPTGSSHKGKKVSEIDRLLQDEGVVNLLYDVEQPDSRKRLVPITKSQKKVMDVEKAERELKLRTKLVKNAVLRLRNSASATIKISPRSRRSAVSDQSQPAADKKASDTGKSQKAPSCSTPSAAESADFVIPAKIRNAADASRIIRRHSSSSFSSASASPRVSVDVPPESMKLDESEALSKSKRKLSHDSIDKADAKKGKKKAVGKIELEDDLEKSPSRKATRSSAAVSAPKVASKSKKVPKSRSSSDALWNDVRGASRDQDELSACLAEAASAIQSSMNGSSSTPNSRRKGTLKADEEKCNKFSNKEINVRQHGHLVQLILTPSAPVSGIRNAITIPVMNEIREALTILRNDDDCRVVLFTSTGTSFCEGLELEYLQHANKEERKVRAEKMANAVKDFVTSLAAFNKPIVAGVQGAATGLGVTMLPLFDLVIASDKATFSTPYGKLGQIAEGAAVLTLSHSLGSAVTNELLLGGRTLTASEALRAGLVTRVLWPDRFQGELLPSLKVMSEQSAQAMEATKALLRRDLRRKLEAALESESLLLVRHWCSQECQEAIKAYIEEKGQ